MSASLPLKKPSFLIIPRGGGTGSGGSGGGGSGGSGGGDDVPISSSSSSSSTITFQQQLKHYDASMTAFLKHYHTATEHMVDVLGRTMELDKKTETALEQLEVGLFRVQIHLSMLPPELCRNYQSLHHEMIALQTAATKMLEQLAIYTNIVTNCLTMVQTLIQQVQQKADELPQLNKDERQLRRRHQMTKHDKLQKSVQDDVLSLQQSTVGINNDILAIDKHAREDVWPVFMEHIQQVQEAAKNVDRIFQSIVVRNPRNNNASSYTVGNMVPPGTSASSSASSSSSSSSPVHNFSYGLEADHEMQEVEVEMTTYEFNVN